MIVVCQAWDHESKDPFSVDAYITEAHENYLQNPGQENSLCGQTCWSVVSMIVAYFQNHGYK